MTNNIIFRKIVSLYRNYESREKHFCIIRVILRILILIIITEDS